MPKKKDRRHTKDNAKQHCIELNTGSNYSGGVYVGPDLIEAVISSYEEFFHINQENDVFLRTENNKFVSLHSILTSTPGSHSKNHEPYLVTYRQRIRANVAVTGDDQWLARDQVRRVEFEVLHSEQLLENKAKFEYIMNYEFGGYFEADVLRFRVNNILVHISYTASRSLIYRQTSNIRPFVVLEFDQVQDIFSYIEHVACVVQFIAMSLGIYTRADNIEVSRLFRVEADKAREAGLHPTNHSIQYVWSDVSVDSSDAWVGGSPIRAWDEDELSSLRDCLSAWMSRHDSWKEANALMMDCLASKQEITGERLLKACKWFEQIPLTKAIGGISESDIGLIVDAAVGKAAELGYGNLDRRIVSVLKPVRSESLDDRLTRLVAMVRAKFGNEILETPIVDHLRAAFRFRGKSAHGYFRPRSKEEFHEFGKSIAGLEALCFLLTAYDLPINAEGLERIGRNSFIREYRWSW